MFCDLVGSTRLSEQLDAEDFRDVLRAYQEAATAVIEDYAGRVAQYLGDGLLVYFGWPQAHEDDAERAIRAGLAIVDAVSELDGNGVRLAVRIGIHTGPVVMGELGRGARRESVATGDTTNVAARLQEIAESGTVVFSAATLRLVAGVFIVRDLGSHRLKGLTEPIHVYRAEQPSGVRSRLDVVPATGLTPFVGRDQELMLLEARYAQAVEGDGQAVLISGEPGIGKSRLVHTFRQRLAARTHTWLECQGSPYTRESAFYPVLELQRQGLGFDPEDVAEKKLEKIETGLAAVGYDPAETTPLLATLHGVPLGERFPALDLSAEQARKKTLELLVEWLLRLGERQPVVLLLEDLHWMDPSTLELVGALLEQVPTASVLLLATYRTDFEQPWEPRSFQTPMLLSRLGRTQLADLVRRAARGRDLPGAWVDEILRRADGVPLFAEELTKSVIESHPQPPRPGDQIPTLQIPETLQDLLMSRLDTLGPAKEIAQVGSALGREFSYALLRAVSPMDEPALQAALRSAVQEELFYQRGMPPEATYLFKHALIQDAAYASLVRRRRMDLHAAIGSALERSFPELVASEPERLAHHCTEAGFARRAIDKWHEAFRQSLRRSAYTEAMGHLRRALELLATQPKSPERDREELDLQLELGSALAMSKGWGSPESERCYARARELCGVVGDERELFPVLWGFWLIHLVRGEPTVWREIAAELRSIAKRHPDSALRLQAQHASWGSPWLGEFDSQLEHIERGLSSYDPAEHSGLAQQFGGHDAGVCAYGHRGVALWATGYPEQSTEAFSAALALADKIAHPPSRAHALMMNCVLATFQSDWAEALRSADAALELSARFGIVTISNMAAVIRGWALVALGNESSGLAVIRQCVESAEPGFATTHAFYAEALYQADQTEQALATLADALPRMERAGEGTWKANAMTLRGHLLLARGLHADAEASYQGGIELARAQSAKMWELRAATSLARMWHSRGKIANARDLLTPVYEGFTEGFDTRDLKDAKALLGELG